jgi:thiol-disulfide isomerase/thioredoxin
MTAQPSPPTRPTILGIPVVALAVGTAALVIAIVAILASGGGDDDTSTAPLDRPAFGEVTVDGLLPPLPKEGADPAIGEPSPVLSGIDFDSGSVVVGEPGEPTLIAFLAHWCPHCQAELPRLVAAEADGVNSTAGAHFAMTSFPFIVVLDADARVVARSAGELQRGELEGFAALARGES